MLGYRVPGGAAKVGKGTALTSQRVISLIPSATEIICALGFQDQLVGRSHECDFPAGVDALPALSEAKFDPRGTSDDINRRVLDVVQEGLSVYRVDGALLNELGPDVIVTQSHCEVCAVSLKELESAVCEFLDTRPAIVSLEPNTLADVWEDILRVADALGVAERGRELVAGLRARLDGIRLKVDKFAGRRPRVVGIEWIEPLMAGGNWMPQLIDIGGGQELFGKTGEHSPWITWEAMREADPDVILLQPCGFDIPRSQADMPAIAGLPGWPSLAAVQAGQVYICDGHQYFSRPGPRLVETVEIIAEILHPELFDFGHEGTGWVRWQAKPAG